MAIFGRRKKQKADFSGVQSGSASTAPAQPVAPQPAVPAPAAMPQAPDAAARSYTVAKGDTLSAIAKREYGDANQWRAIFEANRGTISNPDRIQPGQVLTIPPAR
jgi:nucleoid-associated protein YgaU